MRLYILKIVLYIFRNSSAIFIRNSTSIQETKRLTQPVTQCGKPNGKQSHHTCVVIYHPQMVPCYTFLSLCLPPWLLWVFIGPGNVLPMRRHPVTESMLNRGSAQGWGTIIVCCFLVCRCIHNINNQ